MPFQNMMNNNNFMPIQNMMMNQSMMNNNFMPINPNMGMNNFMGNNYEGPWMNYQMGSVNNFPNNNIKRTKVITFSTTQGKVDIIDADYEMTISQLLKK